MKKTFLISWLVCLYANMLYAETLNIYNWSNYIPKSVIQAFTAKTGIKVIYDSYDSNEILEAKILTGKSGYDLVFPSERPTLDHFIKVGAVQKLDYTKLPNAQYLSKPLMGFVSQIDPNNQYGIIYHWGTIGIGVDTKRVREIFPHEDLSDLSLIFKAENAQKLSKCKITLLDSQAHILPMAFHYLGLSPNSSAPEDIQKTYDLLKPIRPYISNFSSSSYLDQLISKEICYAIGYSGDIFHAIHNAQQANIETDVQYFLPKQGAQMGFDMMAIPADAPHPDAAHAFINYVLDPQVMAKITNHVRYANAVPASTPLLDNDLRDNKNINPPPSLFNKMYVAEPVTPKQARIRNQLWTKFVANR